MGLTDDLYDLLREEETRAAWQRAKLEYLDQLGDVRAPRFRRAKAVEDRSLKPEAEELWGPDKSQWRVDDLAIERALEKERERGTSEEIVEDLAESLRLFASMTQEELEAEIERRRTGGRTHWGGSAAERRSNAPS